MSAMSDIHAKATELGETAGRAAASWVFDGNTSRETYATFIRMSDDGDPEMWDAFGPTSGWLSGEMADDMTARDLAAELGISDDDDADGEILAEACTVYETAADGAYSAELERIARLQLSDDDDAPDVDTSGLDCEGMFGHHSADRVDVYRGAGRLIVCGRHAQEL